MVYLQDTSLARVKEKHQVTIPIEFREQAGLGVGDYLEARVDRTGVTTLVPKNLLRSAPEACGECTW